MSFAPKVRFSADIRSKFNTLGANTTLGARLSEAIMLNTKVNNVISNN